ncbi:MAG: hypothetical protein R3C41_13990 [Calditrichia bacterium]|nr:hypothetical protein [Calditrichota bacterium]MCB0269630.1 hypothetical protein [Calditrichota bacterium]MCB9067062.1 hypothetical protein [Calditrichia bacterium]
MDKRSKFRDLIKYRAGALCLIGILTATFMHTTTFMSQFFYGSLILGGIAALAIDSGVVAMSIFKDELIRDGELAWMVRIVTSMVLFASGVANMSEGFKSAYGIQLTWDSLMSLDPLTWTQWVAGTIVFPILAYVMTDTIGTRNLMELHQQQQNSQRRVENASGIVRYEPMPLNTGDNRALQKARQQRKLTKSQRKQMVFDLHKKEPEMSVSEVAQRVGVSPQTVKGYYKEMGVDTEKETLLNNYSSN